MLIMACNNYLVTDFAFHTVKIKISGFACSRSVPQDPRLNILPCEKQTWLINNNWFSENFWKIFEKKYINSNSHEHFFGQLLGRFR